MGRIQDLDTRKGDSTSKVVGFVSQTGEVVNFTFDFELPENPEDIDSDSIIDQVSTITIDTAIAVEQLNGLNEVSGASGDVTITVDNVTEEDFPIGSLLVFRRNSDDYDIIISQGTATVDEVRTYRDNDIITLWHKSLNVWEALDPPTKPLVQALTQAEYDALTPDAEVLYTITDSQEIRIGSVLVGNVGSSPNPAPTSLIINSTFDNEDDLTLESEWTVSGGVAAYDGNGGSIEFALTESLTASQSYQLTFDASAISTFVRFQLNIVGASTTEVVGFTTYETGSSGEIKVNFTVPSGITDAQTLRFTGSSLAGAYSIDNVSLTTVGQATDVLNGTFADEAHLSYTGSAWSVGTGTLNFDDSNSDDVIFHLDGVIANSESYDFDFEVTSGTIRIENLAGNSVFTNYTVGTHTISFTNSTGGNIDRLLVEFSNGAGATAASIDNVSLTKTS